MKQAVRKRNIAAAVLAAVVLLAGFFGCVRSVAARYQRVIDVFENGDGAQAGSVYSDLMLRAEAAYDLAHVAEKYLPSDDPDLIAALSAAAALKNAEGVESLSEASRRVTETADALSSRLLSMELTDGDEAYRERYIGVLENRLFTMSRDVYNELAADFNENVRGAFPASVICPIAGIERLTLFNEA